MRYRVTSCRTSDGRTTTTDHDPATARHIYTALVTAQNILMAAGCPHGLEYVTIAEVLPQACQHIATYRPMQHTATKGLAA